MSETTSEPAFADVDPNQRFETGWNRLQTATEALVGVIVFAGLLRSFGTGPLSSAEIDVAEQPLVVTYERIMRRTVQAQLTIKITRPVAVRQVSVKLPDTFVQAMDVVNTSPRSSAMRAERDGVTYTFDLGPDGMGDLVFSTKPRSAGIMRSPIEVLGTRVPLSLLVFP